MCVHVCVCVVSGAEGERPPSHEEFPDPGDGGRVFRRGRGQQQEALQEEGGLLHPAGAEEAALHPRGGETQAALQETAQDHPEGADLHHPELNGENIAIST